MACIACDDRLRTGGHRQFDEVVVGFVGEVRPPAEVDAYPGTPAEEHVEQLLPLAGAETAADEDVFSTQDLLVLGKQGRADDRFYPTPKADPDDISRGTVAKTGTDHDVGVDNQPHRVDGSKIATVMAVSETNDDGPAVSAALASLAHAAVAVGVGLFDLRQ